MPAYLWRNLQAFSFQLDLIFTPEFITNVLRDMEVSFRGIYFDILVHVGRWPFVLPKCFTANHCCLIRIVLTPHFWMFYSLIQTFRSQFYGCNGKKWVGYVYEYICLYVDIYDIYTYFLTCVCDLFIIKIQWGFLWRTCQNDSKIYVK